MFNKTVEHISCYSDIGLMTERDQATEDRIFEAARAVFHEQGFDGARMQEIARRAEINHSMLHYYYRSKGRLFDAVFRRAAMDLMPPILEVLRSDLPLAEKLQAFVDNHLRTIRENPHMPGFVLLELRRNPSALRDVIGTAAAGVMERFREDVRGAVEARKIRPIAPEDLLANVLGLCVMPVLSRPMLQTATGMDNEAYDAFLARRAGSVKAFLMDALRP